VAWRIPFHDLQTFDTTVEIAVLEPAGKFALWVTPAYSVPAKQRASIPTKVMWVSADGGITDRTELPSLVPASVGGGMGEKLMGLSMPLAFEAIVLWLMPPQQVEMFPAVWLPMGLAAAFFVWIPLTWWLGRRANHSPKALLAWSIFQVAFGLPGFLAFLCAQEWPARESCSNCKKPRVVDHQLCEHCQAEFAPPQMTGTEIFEPLGMK
jgi:hypothetical protein